MDDNELKLWLESLPLDNDDAAWKQLEAEALGCSHNCPYIGDLIELALGETAPERATKIRDHLKVCSGCRRHFEAYQRGLKLMNINIDPNWLLIMAEKEDNCIISVGGLVTRLEKEDEDDEHGSGAFT
jgi:CO dehydrogenase/acetyl-CoA synthase alpha subunit